MVDREEVFPAERMREQRVTGQDKNDVEARVRAREGFSLKDANADFEKRVY